MTSTFVLDLRVGRQPRLGGHALDRAELYRRLWAELAPHGLLGVHEGTLLSEKASELGLETESWTVDSGEAPRERDWVAGQDSQRAELYFGNLAGAEAARAHVEQWLSEAGSAGVEVLALREQAPRDWDAEWKAAFLKQARGLVIPPGWHVLPPWVSEQEGDVKPGERVLRVNPGAGFGTGTHETTQLCLTALSEALSRDKPERALDFGSGSGILAVALALLGVARVDAVEIDPLAIDNARENARLNGVEAELRFARELEPDARYGVVVANILKPVLLEHCGALTAALRPGGALILSGLIERDVDAVGTAYAAALGRPGQVRSLGEWRCLSWPALS